MRGRGYELNCFLFSSTSSPWKHQNLIHIAVPSRTPYTHLHPFNQTSICTNFALASMAHVSMHVKHGSPFLSFYKLPFLDILRNRFHWPFLQGSPLMRRVWLWVTMIGHRTKFCYCPLRACCKQNFHQVIISMLGCSSHCTTLGIKIENIAILYAFLVDFKRS